MQLNYHTYMYCTKNVNGLSKPYELYMPHYLCINNFGDTEITKDIKQAYTGGTALELMAIIL